MAVCGDGIHAPGEICYGAAISINAGSTAADAQLADMDGDGDLDLVYLLADQYVYHPLDQGSFGTARNGPSVVASHMVALDLDADPHAELVNADATLELWNFDLSSATGYTRTGEQTFTMPNVAVDLTTASFDGQQRPNIVVLESAELAVFAVDAAGALSTVTSQGNITGAEAVAAGKLDADSLDDIVVARASGATLHVSQGNAFATESPLPVTGPLQGIAVGDVDGDMKTDVLVLRRTSTSGTVGVMRAQDGAGMFATPATTADIASLQKPLAAARIDGDMLVDAVAIKLSPKAVVIALGRADGTLGDPVELPIAAAASYVHANADFNGDSVPDIVVTDPASHTVLVLPSDP